MSFDFIWFTQPDGSLNCGYDPRPEDTENLVASLPHATFAAAAPDCMAKDDGNAFCYRALAKCEGTTQLHARNQGSYGTCVGHGTANGADITTACEIVLKGEPETWPGMESADAMYGLGRDLSGNLGGGDGSYGGAAAKAVLFGSLHMKNYDGVIDLSSYSGDRARNWARHGVPENVKDVAHPHPFRSAARVTTVDEARAALQNGYGINICSNQGFSSHRDSDGFARASGSWSHSMTLIAWRSDKRAALIWNSWGDGWISGPVWPEDMPGGSFWCDERTLEHILNAKDSFAYSNYAGFPAQSIDWGDM